MIMLMFNSSKNLVNGKEEKVMTVRTCLLFQYLTKPKSLFDLHQFVNLNKALVLNPELCTPTTPPSLRYTAMPY